MRRLIDAEKYPCMNCTVSYCYKNCKKHDEWLNGCDYDVEKVIEQLNDLPTFKVSATSEKHPFCAYEAEMISKHKVMGIVKKGGAE